MRLLAFPAIQTLNDVRRARHGLVGKIYAGDGKKTLKLCASSPGRVSPRAWPSRLNYCRSATCESVRWGFAFGDCIALLPSGRPGVQSSIVSVVFGTSKSGKLRAIASFLILLVDCSQIGRIGNNERRQCFILIGLST